ncbi:MAG: transglutaminase-like domain-containing protein [Acidobacteriota bacterium]|nr:transglutaminase-like domain-containing protein [Acidobacteriota bacterium]
MVGTVRVATKILEELLSRPEGTWTLTEAALAISRLGKASLDDNPPRRSLDELARQARRRIGQARHPRFVAGSLSLTLFDGFGLTCATREPLPEHCFLDAALRERVASPEMTAVIFLELSRLSGHRFDAIGIPGRMLLKRDHADKPFLFDPTRRCEPIGLDDCRKLVSESRGGKGQFSDGHLRAITPSQVLARLVGRLKDSYWRQNAHDEALSAVGLMLTIRPDDPREIRDGGRLLFLLGRFPEAIRAFESYLVHNPRGEDADVVRMLIQEARAGLPPSGG